MAITTKNNEGESWHSILLRCYTVVSGHCRYSTICLSSLIRKVTTHHDFRFSQRVPAFKACPNRLSTQFSFLWHVDDWLVHKIQGSRGIEGTGRKLGDGNKLCNCRTKRPIRFSSINPKSTLHALHFEELETIWEADRPIPTVSPRRAKQGT
jgi:hypothetical protein